MAGEPAENGSVRLRINDDGVGFRPVEARASSARATSAGPACANESRWSAAT
jgi:hypothetical protein